MLPSPTEEIAAGAARLVVDEGLEYGQAKRKAARSLGRRGRGTAELPSNEQVEDEVRAHLELFCADSQPAELRVMREAALRCMQRLEVFRPHLSGAVWRGTATLQSAIHIDLYCDDSKSAEIALINMGLGYEVMPGDAADGTHYLRISAPPEAGRPPRGSGKVAKRKFLERESDARADEAMTIFLAVRDLDDLRGALKPDARGRSWRGDLAALRRLLAADDAAP